MIGIVALLVVGPAIAALAALGVVALSRRLSPTSPQPDTGLAVSPPGLQTAKFIYLAVFLPLTVAIGMLAEFAFCLLGWIRFAGLPPAEITITPDGFFWGIPSIFVGIAGAGVALEPAMRRLLGDEKYEAYCAAETRRSGIAQKAGLRFVELIAILVSLVALAFGLGSYVQLAGQSLVINETFSFGERKRSVSEIAEIRTAKRLIAPSGKVVPRREWSVRFRDGEIWSTNRLPASLPLAREREFMRVLSMRSGIEIQEVDRLERSEL